MQNLDKFKNKNIFISGGAGIIGKHLVQKLIDNNANLLVGDIKKCPKNFIGKVKYLRKDLNTLKIKELKKFKPDVFIHLAATYERTQETKEFFENNFHNNIKLSNYLITIISKIKSIKKIIFASSYLVYSSDLYLNKKNKKPYKLHETSSLNPRNLIGAAKLYHESELKFLSNFRSDISITSARIFRGYGLGSRDIISRWIRDLIKKKEINIYGISSSFDFIYCKDTAESILKMINLRHKFKIVNVGYGQSIKINDILKILNLEFKNIKKNKINGNQLIENSYADISIIKKKMKLNLRYSIKKGIREIIEYEKKRIKYSN
jgi:carbamoyl-phosphate synthase large subunit